MIDTIKIKLTDFHLRKENLFMDQRVKTRYKGEEKVWEKKYCNLSHFHSDIYNDRALIVSTSLPFLIHPTNYFEITPEDYDLCINKIFERLQIAGVDCDKADIENGQLSRIDFCKGIIVDGSILEYLNLLRQFEMPYRTTIPYKRGSVYFRNDSRELIVYDPYFKIMSDKKRILEQQAIEGMSEKKLRFEAKYKNRKAIRHDFRFFSLRDAFRENLSRTILLREYDTLINFKMNADNSICYTHSELLGKLRNQYSRGNFYKFLAVMGIGLLLKDYDNNISAVKELVSWHYEKSQVSYLMKEIDKLNRFNFSKSSTDMVQEMRQKLAALN